MGKFDKLIKALGKAAPAAEEAAAKMFQVGDISFPAANTAQALQVKRALEEAGRVAPNRALQALSANKKLAATGLAAAGAATLGGQEEASAGPMKDYLKILRGLPKEQASKAFDEALNSGKLKNLMESSLDPRNEFGGLSGSTLRKNYSELGNLNLSDPEHIQRANEFISKQLGSQPFNVVSAQDYLKNPENIQRLENKFLSDKRLIPNNMPIKDAVDQALLKEFNRTGGSYTPATGEKRIHLTDNQLQDPDKLLNTFVHEIGHEKDRFSGKNLGSELFTPENMAKVNAQFGETFVSPLDKRLISLPENTRTGAEKHIAASLMKPEEFEQYAKYLKAKDPMLGNFGETVQQANFMDNLASPELALNRGSLYHSMNAPKGLEYELGKAAAVDKLDPIENMKSRFSPDSLKKAAAMAPVAGMQQAQFENPLDMIKKGFDTYREKIADPLAEKLKGQMTPDMTVAGKTYSTATPVTDLGTSLLADPMNYAEGPLAGGLAGLDALSSFAKTKQTLKNNK